MARTIKQIQQDIIDALQTGDGAVSLSASRAAEWRLWTYVVAAAIHAFELLLDLFRVEINELSDRITPGTERWYAQMCRRFQNGHELLFDEKTAALYYAEDDPAARIIKVVAVTVNNKRLALKVARMDDSDNIVPLEPDELYNFKGYIAAIKFASDAIDVISTSADLIRYDVEVYYNPSVPASDVYNNVKKALSDFRLSINFDARFYTQQFIDAIMHAAGVVTVDLKTIEQKRAADTQYIPINVVAELQSGYFDYAPDCLITLTSTKIQR